MVILRSVVLVLALLAGPMAIGAVAQVLSAPEVAFWVGFGISVALLPILWTRLTGEPSVIVLTLLVWFAIHKVLAALLAPHVATNVTVWFSNYQEAMYPSLFIVLVAGLASRPIRAGRLAEGLRRLTRHMIAADCIALMLIALVILYFLVGVAFGGTTLEHGLTYARRFASLPGLYITSRLLRRHPSQFQAAAKALVVASMLLAALGLVEWLILGTGFWRDTVQVAKYQDALVAGGFASTHARLLDGIPANWFAYLDGTPVRRLVSTFVEPTTLAIFLALALGLAAAVRPKTRSGTRGLWWVGVGVILTALVLTIGKAGWAIAGVIVVVAAMRTTRGNAVWVIGVGVVFGALTLSVGLLTPFGNNLGLHLQGLASGIGHMIERPLGSGLGSTGFWGDIRFVGTDSTVGTIASQVGVVGAGLWITWLATLGYHILPERRHGDPRASIRWVLGGGILAFLLASFVSESTSGLLAGAPYVMLGGWLVSIINLQEPPETTL